MWRSILEGSVLDPAELLGKLLWVQVPTQVLGQMLQIAMTLLLCYGLALMYFDLRSRREGTDLLAMLEESSTGPPRDASSSEPWTSR